MSAESAAPPPAVPFIPLLVQMIRAHNHYEHGGSKDDAALIQPFIVDREQRKQLPLIGDPDAATLERVRQYYGALCLAIERHTGVLPTPICDITGEGFGRVLLFAGGLVLINRAVRDLHRFGFLSLEVLEAEAAKVVASAAERLFHFPEVARL